MTDSAGNPKIIISLFDHPEKWSLPYSAAGFQVVAPGNGTKDWLMNWDYKNNGFLKDSEYYVCGVVVAFQNADLETTKKLLEIIRFFGEWHWGYHGGDYEKGDTKFFWCIENPLKETYEQIPSEVGAVNFVFSPKTTLFGEFEQPQINSVVLPTPLDYANGFFDANH